MGTMGDADGSATTLSLLQPLKRQRLGPQPLEPRLEVAAAGGLALHGGDDRSQAVLWHALEPEPTLGVGRLIVGTPIRLALQVSE